MPNPKLKTQRKRMRKISKGQIFFTPCTAQISLYSKKKIVV